MGNVGGLNFNCCKANIEYTENILNTEKGDTVRKESYSKIPVDNSINLTFLGDEKREEEDTWDVTYLMKNYM